MLTGSWWQTPPGAVWQWIFGFASLLSLITVIVTAASWALWFRRRMVSQNALELLLNIDLMRKHGCTIVIPSRSAAADIGPSRITNGDIQAAAAFRTTLRNLQIKALEKYDDQVTDEDKLKNLILICGPAGNSVTKQAFERCVNHPHKFERSEGGDWRIQSTSSGTLWHTTTKRVDDRAIFVRRSNPWNTHTQMLIIAGIGELGTRVTAETITSNPQMIWSKIKSRKLHAPSQSLSIVLTCHLEDDVARSEVLEIETIE